RNGVGERSIAVVDADGVVSRPCVDRDRVDRLEVDAEIGRAVVPGIDFEDVGASRSQPKRDLVVPVGAEDDQAVVSNLRTLKVAYVRLAVSARSTDNSECGAQHNRCNETFHPKTSFRTKLICRVLKT